MPTPGASAPGASSVPDALAEGTWVNADRPLTAADLEGSPTLVVRWRTDDVTSTAALLAAQAHAPGHGARVVGLHVPGRPTERDPATVRHAVLRERIHVPVRLDPDATVARQLGLWRTPSHAVIDEAARVTARHPGPPDERTWRGLDTSKRACEGARHGWDVRGDAVGPTPLVYPQGLAVDGDTVAIADTGHDRVLLLAPDQPPRSIGEGAPGDRDGPLERARFFRPRGLHLDGDHLFVADAGNHAIRRIDLASERVDTLASNQELSNEAPVSGLLGPTPMDLAPMPGDPDAIVVALAGHDALARLDPGTGRVERMPGAADGPGRGLLQPIGVASDEDRVYVLDPLRFAVRALDPTTGQLATVAAAPGVRLGTPTALASDGAGRLLVADAGSGQLVRLDAATGGYETIDGLERFEEPRALAVHDGDLLVADATHRVRRVEPGTARVQAVEIDLPADLDADLVLDPVEAAPDGEIVLHLAAHRAGDLATDAAGLPSVRGPLEVRTVSDARREGHTLIVRLTGRLVGNGHALVRWRLDGVDGEREHRWRVPLIVRPGAEDRVELRLSTRLT